MKNVFLITALVFSGTIFAQPRGGDRVPPENAISVCEGKADQSSCTMEGRRGDQLSGTCENTPDGAYFACKPSHRGGRRGSSQE